MSLSVLESNTALCGEAVGIHVRWTVRIALRICIRTVARGDLRTLETWMIGSVDVLMA